MSQSSCPRLTPRHPQCRTIEKSWGAHFQWKLVLQICLVLTQSDPSKNTRLLAYYAYIKFKATSKPKTFYNKFYAVRGKDDICWNEERQRRDGSPRKRLRQGGGTGMPHRVVPYPPSLTRGVVSIFIIYCFSCHHGIKTSLCSHSNDLKWIICLYVVIIINICYQNN